MTEPTLSRERRVHCMDTRGGLVPDSRCPQFFTLTPLGALKSVKRHITDSTHPLCWSSLGLMPQCNNNAITPAVQVLHPPVSQQSLRIYYSIKLILSMQMQEASVISHNSRKSLSPRNNYHMTEHVWIFMAMAYIWKILVPVRFRIWCHRCRPHYSRPVSEDYCSLDPCQSNSWLVAQWDQVIFLPTRGNTAPIPKHVPDD